MTPLVRQPGIVAVSTRRVYFEPAALNNVGDASLCCPLAELASARKARHLMARRGLELDFRDAKGARKALLRLAFDRSDRRGTQHQ